jgi:uncharacterized lipoprotein
VKRATLIALTALFTLGLAACDRPATTDRSAQRSNDTTYPEKDKTSPTKPSNAPTGTPPASK